jgi:hypothetical protein
MYRREAALHQARGPERSDDRGVVSMWMPPSGSDVSRTSTTVGEEDCKGCRTGGKAAQDPRRRRPDLRLHGCAQQARIVS